MTRLSLLGIRLSTFNLPTAAAEMAQAVAERRLSYASTCPVYTLMQGHERADVKSALNGADWVTPDGMPVVWALKRLGASGVGRVYGPDLMLALSAISAERGYRQFYLGGAPGVAEDLARAMQQRCPGLRVAGVYSPPFGDQSPAEERAMLDCVNASGADIVWVGLGSPKQDLWMARYRPLLSPPLLVAVGAAFDFFTGRQPQAPVWMQRGGLEWLFRLGASPKRLWRRYLVYNPRFLLQVGMQLAGLRRYN